jgi:hypothetical protein
MLYHLYVLAGAACTREGTFEQAEKSFELARKCALSETNAGVWQASRWALAECLLAHRLNTCSLAHRACTSCTQSSDSVTSSRTCCSGSTASSACALPARAHLARLGIVHVLTNRTTKKGFGYALELSQRLVDSGQTDRVRASAAGRSAAAVSPLAPQAKQLLAAMCAPEKEELARKEFPSERREALTLLAKVIEASEVPSLPPLLSCRRANERSTQEAEWQKEYQRRVEKHLAGYQAELKEKQKCGTRKSVRLCVDTFIGSARVQYPRQKYRHVAPLIAVTHVGFTTSSQAHEEWLRRRIRFKLDQSFVKRDEVAACFPLCADTPAAGPPAPHPDRGRRVRSQGAPTRAPASVVLTANAFRLWKRLSCAVKSACCTSRAWTSSQRSCRTHAFLRSLCPHRCATTCSLSGLKC